MVQYINENIPKKCCPTRVSDTHVGLCGNRRTWCGWSSLYNLFTIFLFLALLAIPEVSFAAISFDNGTTPAITSGVQNIYWTQTVSGANRLGIIDIYHDTNGDVVSGAACGNGSGTTTATLVAKVNNTMPTDVWEYMFYCIAPPTGTATFEITQPGVETGNVIYSSRTYDGVAQSGQPDSSSTNNGSAGSASSMTLTTTSIANNSWAIMMERDGFSATWSVSPGTIREEGTNMVTWDSNGPISPAGSYSSTITYSTSGTRYAGIIATFSPATSVVSTPSAFQQIFGWW